MVAYRFADKDKATPIVEFFETAVYTDGSEGDARTYRYINEDLPYGTS